MSCETEGANKAVARRYRREMSIAALVYAFAIVASVFVVRRLDPPQWAAVVLALASAAPALLIMRAYLRLLNGLDEFQRRVQMESVLVASAIVCFASFTYGFLQSFADFPALEDSLIWVFPATMLVWGVVQPFVRRRYQ